MGGELVVGHLSNQVNSVWKILLLYMVADILFKLLNAAANDEQMNIGYRFGNPRERIDQEGQVLFERDPARVNDQDVTRFLTQRFARDRLRVLETLQIDAVRNDLDIPLHL